MKAFKCSFPIYLAFNMSTLCSERTTRPETIFFSVDFRAENKRNIVNRLVFIVTIYHAVGVTF